MSKIKISDLIDRVISIAKQNNDDELLKWAYLESMGYFSSNKYLSESDKPPKYREIAIEHRDIHDNPLYFTHPQMRDINYTFIKYSVLELEEMSSKNKYFKARDPMILDIIQKNYKIPAAYFIFSSQSLFSILNSIKHEALNRIEKYVNREDIMRESFKINDKNHKNNTLQNSIFVSFSFTEQDKELVDGIIELLKLSGFRVITGEKNPIGSISKSILKKIGETEKFIVIMTKRDKKENRKYTTSSWLLEEKGIAIAYGKPCIIFVEEGIDKNEIGGMQGDDQRLHFTRNNFTSKVADAIKMLKGEVE
ncbi:MAG: hypothetical protein K8S23_13620 [Candidatus Cloacimonetes bacterium]|nr:hypothetical protein [Candidatus Cloacimonadota bacterium]